MAMEVERKFLVQNNEWRSSPSKKQDLRQGYLCAATPPSLAEVRVRCKAGQALLTIKSAGSLVRSEFEYEIPLEDAETILKELCSNTTIEKTRHTIEFADLNWEVDEYRGAHAGLVIAEVELQDPGQEPILPNWVGAEVTDDPRFRNSELAYDGSSWRQAVVAITSM